MEPFNELQQLWQTAKPAPAPPASGIIRLVKKQRRNILLRTAGGMAALLWAVAVIAWVFISYHPHLATTRISMVMILLAVTGVIILQSRALHLLSGKVNDAVDNTAMLTSLRRLQLQQRRFNSIGISVYFVLLSVGMALYLAEFVRGNIRFGIIAYGLTFGWIAFVWFYLRKRSIRRQNARLDAVIEQLETLQQHRE